MSLSISGRRSGPECHVSFRLGTFQRGSGSIYLCRTHGLTDVSVRVGGGMGPLEGHDMGVLEVAAGLDLGIEPSSA